MDSCSKKGEDYVWCWKQGGILNTDYAECKSKIIRVINNFITNNGDLPKIKAAETITECFNLNSCYLYKEMKNVDWYYARDYCKKRGAKLFEPILPFQYQGKNSKEGM